MPLPPRVFQPLNEVAIRWSAKPLDIIGWAIDGQDSAFYRAAVSRDQAEKCPVEGFVEKSAPRTSFDLFSTEANKKASVRIQRFRRHAGRRWERIIAPSDGVPLKPSGVVITRSAIERFERDYPLSGPQFELGGEKSAGAWLTISVGQPPRRPAALRLGCLYRRGCPARAR